MTHRRADDLHPRARRPADAGGRRCAIPYEGPHDEDGVPLTAYCQDLKAYVRAHPELNEERGHRHGDVPRCRECGALMQTRRRWYCEPCRATVVAERRRERRRQQDAERRERIKAFRPRRRRNDWELPPPRKRPSQPRALGNEPAPNDHGDNPPTQ